MIGITILVEEQETDDSKRTTMSITEVISDQEIKAVTRPKELLRLQLLKMVDRIIERMQIGE